MLLSKVEGTAAGYSEVFDAAHTDADLAEVRR